MKNFLRTDSSELMTVRLILASWAQKQVISTLWTWCTSSSWKISSRRFERADGCYTHFGILSPKTSDSYFVDMMYVECMKNFLLVDSSGVLAVRLILASWAQKQAIPTLQTWCTSCSWKIFFSPIRASWWLLDSFWHPEPKNKWFLLSRHDVRRVHEKFSSSRFERDDGC